MASTYKRMEAVLLQHLDELQSACASISSSTTSAPHSGTPIQVMSGKENSENLTPEPTEDDLRLQSSPFGVKNLLMASGGMRAQNSQKLHCV